MGEIGFFVVRPKRIPTIRSRLVLLVIACVLPASLMVVCFISYFYFQGRAALTQSSLTTARAMMTSVDRELEAVQAGLLALATSEALTSGNLSSFYEQSEEVLKTLKARNILLIDQSAQQLLNTLRPFGSVLPSEAGHPTIMQVFQTDRPFITDLMIGMVAQEPLIVIVVPVRRGDRVIYILAATLRPEQLSKLLAKQRLDTDWIGVIFDSAGIIVARTHQMARFVGMKGAPAVVARAAEVAEDVLEVDSVEGISILSAFSSSPVTHWTVAIGIPSRLLANQLWLTIAWLALGTALLLSGSLVIAWVIKNQISRPIHLLAAPALALGSGVAVSVPFLNLREADEVGRALTKASGMLLAAQHNASHDILTGLANRALFDEILNHQLAICGRNNSVLAVLYIDLDGFKAVNDSHGHATGDELLCIVATRLKRSIRESDLAARLGGDEFALILIHAELDAAQTVAQKVINALSAPYSVGALMLTVSASVGIATYPESGTTSEAISQNADEAMYRAKAAGKRRYAPAN